MAEAVYRTGNRNAELRSAPAGDLVETIGLGVIAGAALGLAASQPTSYGYEICRYSGEFEDPSVDNQYKFCTYSCEGGEAMTIPYQIGSSCPPIQVRTHK